MYLCIKPIPTDTMHSYLMQKKNNYLAFANMTEENIRDIWYEQGDMFVENLKELKYNSDHPTWCKMIFRYRNSSRNPIRMLQGVTFKNKMLYHYNLRDYAKRRNSLAISPEYQPYIDFFFWIACSLDLYTLRDLTGIRDTQVSSNEMFNDFDISEPLKTAQENCIGLFYGIASEYQIKMLDKYNAYISQFNSQYEEERK